MRKIAALFFAFLVPLLTPYAFADVTAIHADKLPQETAVLAALDDAKQLEPYSHTWTNKWRFEIAKEEVATRLGKDLGYLTLAVKNHPDNSELLLLTGLVARYAYNFDLPGSYETALSVLGHAHDLVPADLRSPWFRATLMCQTAQSKAGADEFLSIEASHAWDQLSASFWEDYMECASNTMMPNHVLRAIDHLEKLHAPASEMRAALPDIEHKRFDSYDSTKNYDPAQVWTASISEETPVFTSTTCGVRLRTHRNWKINRIAVSNGCIIVFSTSSYQGTVHQLIPNIALLVKQPDGNETLQEFFRKYQRGTEIVSYTPSRCPSDACIAVKGVQPGNYSEDGGGHSRLVSFERNQPEFPGLIFEEPWQPPKSDGSSEGKLFHPNQIQQRIPGKLYYVVLLDTAASIEEPAMKDFDFFLTNLTVE